MKQIETATLHRGVAGARHTFLPLPPTANKLDLLLQVRFLWAACLGCCRLGIACNCLPLPTSWTCCGRWAREHCLLTGRGLLLAGLLQAGLPAPVSRCHPKQHLLLQAGRGALRVLNPVGLQATAWNQPHSLQGTYRLQVTRPLHLILPHSLASGGGGGAHAGQAPHDLLQHAGQLQGG